MSQSLIGEAADQLKELMNKAYYEDPNHDDCFSVIAVVGFVEDHGDSETVHYNVVTILPKGWFNRCMIYSGFSSAQGGSVSEAYEKARDCAVGLLGEVISDAVTSVRYYEVDLEDGKIDLEKM
jgi:hypothetical protein